MAFFVFLLKVFNLRFKVIKKKTDSFDILQRREGGDIIEHDGYLGKAIG